MVEGPIPGGCYLRRARDEPMNQPRGGRFFHVRIPGMFAAEEASAEIAPLSTRPVFFDDSARQRPVADGERHVLSDTERDDRFRVGEDTARLPALYCVEGFTQP